MQKSIISGQLDVGFLVPTKRLIFARNTNGLPSNVTQTLMGHRGGILRSMIFDFPVLVIR